MQITKLDYVDKAENAIKSLSKNKWGGIYLTTSKIRNILSMVNELGNDLALYEAEKLDEDVLSRIQYLRMRLAYECGREGNVKDFSEKAKLFEIINEIGDSKANAKLFCNYMESLVAYHKFYGGKD